MIWNNNFAQSRETFAQRSANNKLCGAGVTGGALNLKFNTTADTTTVHGKGDDILFNIGN